MVKFRGRGRKTWKECVKDGMKLLGLLPEWAIFRDMWIVEGLNVEQIFKINDDEVDPAQN